MKNLFLPYKLALIAREKGFPNNTGSCLAAWEVNDNAEWLHFGAHPIGLLQAPTYQQLIDWFREKHEIMLYPYPVRMKKTWKWNVESDKHLSWYSDKDYYKCQNKAIEEAFKLIIKQSHN